MKWATKVVAFSSQYVIPNQATEYAAVQALGRPSKLPNIGTSVCAWQPAIFDNKNDDFIQVSFDTLMVVRQIAIAENQGQGCIIHIYAYDQNGKENLLFSENKEPINQVGRMFTIILDQPTTFQVKELKIVLNTARVKGPNQIDAIGISTDAIPFVPKINFADTEITNFKKENLGPVINSKVPELAPVISPDGKELFFTRTDHPENFGMQDVWSSKYLDGKWQSSKNIGPPINNADNNAACSISSDGKTLYLVNKYNTDGTMEKGMSKSTLGRAGWSFPETLKIDKYNNYGNDSEFCVGGNNRVLIYTANNRNSIGGRDMYYSRLLPGGSWSAGKNLGNMINTADDEYSPYLASDNKSLYFSTKGYPTIGGFDIFVSKRLDDTWTNWSEPINLGKSINTPDWDGYFTIPASGEYAYLCSRNESIGLEDIFRVKISEGTKPEAVAIVSGSVLNSVTSKPMDANVLANVLGEKSDSVKIDYSPLTGEFKMILPLKKKYVVYAKQKGYLSINESIDLSKDTKYREIKRNLYLMPIEAGQKAQLKDVVFKQSSSEMLPESYPELDKMVEMMKENLVIEIHLDGHTDNQGDWNQNIILSENRVKEVKSYMISKGIAGNRISTKAWGGSKAIFSNESETTRMKNRRVEFTIKKK
jgi:outer membrane protein OmpA-like peptidoglycan-associated protein